MLAENYALISLTLTFCDLVSSYCASTWML